MIAGIIQESENRESGVADVQRVLGASLRNDYSPSANCRELWARHIMEEVIIPGWSLSDLFSVWTPTVVSNLAPPLLPNLILRHSP